MELKKELEDVSKLEKFEGINVLIILISHVEIDIAPCSLVATHFHWPWSQASVGLISMLYPPRPSSSCLYLLPEFSSIFPSELYHVIDLGHGGTATVPMKRTYKCNKFI